MSRWKRRTCMMTYSVIIGSPLGGSTLPSGTFGSFGCLIKDSTPAARLNIAFKFGKTGSRSKSGCMNARYSMSLNSPASGQMRIAKSGSCSLNVSRHAFALPICLSSSIMSSAIRPPKRLVGFLEQTFGAVDTDKPGQPPLPTRLMAGADAVAPADGAREAQGAAAGELGGGDPDGRDEALRPRLCCDRYDGAAEGGDVSDRRQAAQPGARAAGATDEEARSEPAPILCAGRQVGSDQAPALRPCPSVQARQPQLTQAQDLSRPCHPRHRAAHCRE